MLAVVTPSDGKSDRRRIKTVQYGRIVHISVGSKVSDRRLKKVLAPFEGRFLAAEGIKTHSLRPFDPSPIAERLLFEQFCRYVLTLKGDRTAVAGGDPAGRHIGEPLFTEVVAHAAAVTVFTLLDTEALCEGWLKATGTCPDTVDRKAFLYSADCCFAPQGFLGFEGTLFGLGGRDLDCDSIPVPFDLLPLFSTDIDRKKLICLIKSAENRYFDRIPSVPTEAVYPK